MRRTKQAGINFLNDEELAKRIVSVVRTADMDVLEIGAGLGQLTRHIRDYRSLTLIEREREFADLLRATFDRATVINADALKVEWPKFSVFISNMPYSISTPLLERLWKCDFREGVVTIQKEVADRITAIPGTKEYSRLTVMMQLKFNVERRFDVPPSKFTPVPRVYSTVLRLEPRPGHIPKGFDDFLKKIFSQRRKKMRNILEAGDFGDRRPEEFSTAELLEIFEKVSGQQRS
ncbi:MAG: 16S rRNA (adenine(1518)-N(6)/adenine(1519)-N(6))-dimethyltransferase RsmA [Candidatus Thermoplasmatota archaeon]|jgi:16S rRNA (adenine1518-N6/adenine1519-N6)-dimethyltransferase|nr:16S rRNA (adenine(1518)-N(6)/adenine(1519)-N(6))-dimethyltransferase RsmA [Candidatus Thermoplasmatota archaeon]MCL5789334.1 16S rRNA (adenine(1518)-N(6)/adenine(1519)-N(6))-dimethyltransferase RsmA [Candidatus Thermoplasmatota archaeon]